jgi:transposase
MSREAHVRFWERAGVGLLRATRLPLYRQAEIFARDGVSLETSTLCGWVGATAAALQPLIDALAADILAGDTLHVDDTPVPMLAPGSGKTKTGRLWTYVRDERPFAGSRKPAALFFYSSDRKGEHPQAHLKEFRGVIHADGGACPRAGRRPDPGAEFNELFAGDRILEAACWAHVRRKFFDVHAATGSPVAKEALDRIGQLYAVEKIINGLPPERRRQRRQLQSKPIAEALATWAESTVRQLSRKSELAQAFRYMRARWTALVRCFDDGRLALDNNPAERALRCVAIGRKNYLFAGSDAGGRRAAALYSLIESAKLNGLNPQHYLADVLARIADHPARRIAELLPWNWQPLDAARAAS